MPGLEGIDHVAQGLGHLGVVGKPVAMHIEMAVQGKPGGFEHGRPENGMRFEDVLGHKVFSRPELRKILSVRPAQAADIGQQGVKPDIADVILVKGQFYAPGQAAFGPRDAQILEIAGFKHGNRFRAIARGADKVRILLKILPEPGQVARHFEEIVFFADKCRFYLVLGAKAVLQLLFCIKALAAVAVMTAKLAKINIARVIHALQKILHGPHMFGRGCAHKKIIGNAQFGP